MSDRAAARLRLGVLAALLFLSGGCALVYQIVWLRLLSLTFGVTVYAASTVLAAFMAGLCIGSLAAGRLADRTARPLRLFAGVELLIGLCALAAPNVLARVHALYVTISSADSPAADLLVSFVVPFAVLLLPTSLMGATMPLVLKSTVAGREGLGMRAGLLYATNTAGAIAGTLGAGLFLIPQVGLQRSIFLAAAGNALVGASAFVFSRLAERGDAAQQPPALGADAPPPPPGLSSALRFLVLAVFAVSGFASLGLEIVWFRALAISVGPSSYAFTLMLATVLAGIALGSYLITPFMRRRVDWLQVLALVQMVAALVALRSFHGLRRAPRAPAWFESLWPDSIAFMAPTAAASITAILPTAVLLGLAFPIGLHLWVGDGAERRTGGRVGLFYAVNLLGGILGSVVVGFVLLPALTSRGSLVVMAALFLLSGLALQAPYVRRRPLMTAIAIAAVLVFAVRAREIPRTTTIVRSASGPLLWHDEGVQTTVSVFGGPGTGNRVMYIDSHHQANDSAGMVFVHARIGLLPAVLHPAPRRALIVGLGGGATAGALSQYPGIQLDIVELSKGVVRGAELFSHVNFDVLRRPNVRTRVGDARNHLLRTPGGYDVITADAIVPRNPGATNLYSVEYFRLVRDALAPGGIALHWNGAAEQPEYRLILRAFVAAFPQTTLWGDGKLMVGWKDEPRVSRARIEALLQDPETRRVLALMNVERFDHLARMFRANPEQARELAGPGAPLSDDRPLIEYFARLPPDPSAGIGGIRGDIDSILQR
jgi:spermidine synthase